MCLQQWRWGGFQASSAPIQICLIGFDSHNYRVIMAFSSRPCWSEKQLLSTPTCCQIVYGTEWATEEREERWGGGRWRFCNGLWLSSGYWVFDRTPGGRGSNNDRINGQGTTRMSPQQGAAVAFELPSDASMIILSTVLWKDLTCLLLVDLKCNFFLYRLLCQSQSNKLEFICEWGSNAKSPHSKTSGQCGQK